MKIRWGWCGFWAVLVLGQQAVQAQEFPATPFRLDNPSLIQNPTLPSFFNREAVLSSAALAWTPSPLPTSRTFGTTIAPTRTERSLLDRLASFSPTPDYVTGEIGFTYGRAMGKYGGDFKESYILGEVGNEHLHIMVGAAYQDYDFHLRR